MPPAPILALASFVGLSAYLAIGGAVGALAVWRISPTVYSPYLAGKRNYGYGWEVWATFAPFVVFWPLAVALGLVGMILAGPAWASLRVGRYVAAALEGEDRDAT